tara:strand:+ start:802 stop:1821 length:1020 start_codon:yes stop_codon:yes gene_type:complete
METKKINLNIDTTYRNNYSNTESTDFTYILPTPIHNVTSLKLVSNEIPHMWYVFSDKYQTNTFRVEIFNYVHPDDIADPNNVDENFHSLVFRDSSFNITIPQGNYLSGDLIDVINNFFLNTNFGVDNLIFDIDESTSHCIFRARSHNDEPNNEPAPFEPTSVYYSRNFRFNIFFNVPAVSPERPLQKNAGWMLGFEKESYSVDINNTTNIATAMTRFSDKIYVDKGFLESESSYGRSTLQYFFLEINDFTGKNFNSDAIISSVGNTFLGNNILARISVTDSPNTIIFTDNSDNINKNRNYNTPVSISKLHIRLLDKYGDVIDINRNNYSLLLELTIKTN